MSIENELYVVYVILGFVSIATLIGWLNRVKHRRNSLEPKHTYDYMDHLTQWELSYFWRGRCPDCRRPMKKWFSHDHECGCKGVAWQCDNFECGSQFIEHKSSGRFSCRDSAQRISAARPYSIPVAPVQSEGPYR